jgi:hypothetical protein
MAWGRSDRHSDQVAYQGRVWQAYRGGNDEVRLKTVRFDGTDFQDFELPGGGRTAFRPAIWTDYQLQFIGVGVRGGDDALYHMASGDGFAWPAAYEYQGGLLTDAPVARSYRQGRYVYTAQGTAGRVRQVYNGDWSDWQFSDSAEIALGTNLIGWDDQFAELDQSLDVLRPEVVRVRFAARRADILDHLVNNRDVRTIIFNGSDGGLTWEDFQAEIAAPYGGVDALTLARRYPSQNFIWELGNEPDQNERWRGDPGGARDAVVRTANLWRGQQEAHPNFQLGVSLPTWGEAGNDRAYFDAFCDGGATLDAFDVVCVHGYGFTCIALGNHNSVAIVDAVKALTTWAIYITEANLDILSLRGEPPWNQRSFAETWEEIGKRLVDGLSQWDGPEGQVRGVCMFQTDFRNTSPSNYRFHMDTEFNPDLINEPRNVPLPRLGHQAMRLRARSTNGCPKFPQ